MSSNPIEASVSIILGFLCNCFSCFITARITFTCILYLQCLYILFISYRHHRYVFKVLWLKSTVVLLVLVLFVFHQLHSLSKYGACRTALNSNTNKEEPVIYLTSSVSVHPSNY